MERFRGLVMEMGLPRHDFSLFGITCPYCGKSDRIRRLEGPRELETMATEYEAFWSCYGQGGDLAVCKFCQQLLRLEPDRGRVTPLLPEEA